MSLFFLHNFERPWIFIILTIALIGVVILLFFRSKNNNFTDTRLLKQVYGNNTFWQNIFRLNIFILCFGSILILSGLYSNLEKQTVTKEGIDIQIVLDLSYSMIAEDIEPRRIDAAKEMLGKFVGEIYSDRVGVILFSGKPFQSVPLTHDYDFLQDFIDEISVDTVAQSTNVELAGTALGDGLILASDILSRDYPEREKVIILITDGEANKGVKPELALRLLKQEGIKTYTIGVGKGEDTTITIPVGNFVQKVLVSGVDEEILQKISNETGGAYFRADSSNTFQNILENIAELEKTELEYDIYTSQQSYNIYILLIMLGAISTLGYIYFYKKITI